MVFLSSARVVLDQADISRAVRRISHEIVENSRGSDDLIILGIPTRGVPLARRIAETVAQIEGHPVPCGAIDVTLYRDDLRDYGKFERSSRPISLHRESMGARSSSSMMSCIRVALFAGPWTPSMI